MFSPEISHQNGAFILTLIKEKDCVRQDDTKGQNYPQLF